MPDLRIAVLYYTPSLPAHWVAEDEHGKRWLLPVSPLSPMTWMKKRRQYHGNYDLTPMVPQSLMEHYQPDSKHRMLRVGEAALRAGLSDVTIRSAGDSGQIPMIRVGKRKERRFRPEDIDAYLEGLRTR